MSDHLLDLSQFTDAGLEAARFALCSTAGWDTTPPHLRIQLLEMAHVLEWEIKNRAAEKPHVGWRPRVIDGDGVQK